MQVSEKPVIVPQGFIDDFEKVVAHYRLRELGEYEEAKAHARRDLEGALVCFRSLAEDIT